MQVLAHNLLSQFTNRQLNITSKEKGKSAEKLSSGYRINRSADDAAGLQISEKMRSQIRGLNQASRNIQDGISLCQVADGALNETHDILQRMRELSVQAANDTNQEIDRAAIQAEIDELTKEVDRIAGTTSFNQDIYPLKGNLSTEESGTEINSNKDNLAWSFSSKLDISAYTNRITRFDYSFDSITNQTSLDKEHLLQTIIGLGMNISAGEKIIISTEYKVEDTTGGRVGNLHNIYALNDTTNQKVLLGEHTFYDVQDYHNPFMGADHNLFYDSASGSGFLVNFHISSADKGTLSKTIISDILGNKNTFNMTFSFVDNSGGLSDNGDVSGENQGIWIQSGANSGQGIFLSLVNATAKGIGITDPGLDVMSYDNASTSISRLDDAINKVSSYRSHFGARQNRLEYAKSVDDNTAENTQYAESRIRDTDMAEEIVEYSKHNILSQAGQSMLAQANQSTQGILNLLQ